MGGPLNGKTLELCCDEDGIAYVRNGEEDDVSKWARYQLDTLIGTNLSIMTYRFSGYGGGDFLERKHGDDGAVSDQEAAGRRDTEHYL